MAPFHSKAFPECLAIASEEGLVIGTIDDIQKLHIRTVPLGEQPRRLCHVESKRAFVLLSPRTWAPKPTTARMSRAAMHARAAAQLPDSRVVRQLLLAVALVDLTEPEPHPHPQPPPPPPTPTPTPTPTPSSTLYCPLLNPNSKPNTPLTRCGQLYSLQPQEAALSVRFILTLAFDGEAAGAIFVAVVTASRGPGRTSPFNFNNAKTLHAPGAQARDPQLGLQKGPAACFGLLSFIKPIFGARSG